MTLPLPVVKLLEKGVRIPAPFSVEIGDEVDPDRISAEGVLLSRGTRLSGAKTLISAGTRLGCEAPVALDDCLLGRDVELRGGSFCSCALLDRVQVASGAHVREGCILEEEARGGHTVGLKQTILFPYATLGSLINFCDCLLAGGTSAKDHSEVGSSYVHFNYTPNQDKATPSLLGDVPRGVMLAEPPIFLGGQGGLVGPVRIGFGTVIAAGVVWRGDCPEGGKLLTGAGGAVAIREHRPGVYGDIRRRTANNILYIANLRALRQWYSHCRRGLSGDPLLGGALLAGVEEQLERAVAERLTRFREFVQKVRAGQGAAEALLPADIREPVLLGQRQLSERWPEVEAALLDGRDDGAGLKERDAFLAKLPAAKAAQGSDYLRTIRALDRDARAAGTAWLRQVVDAVAGRAFAPLPALRG